MLTLQELATVLKCVFVESEVTDKSHRVQEHKRGLAGAVFTGSTAQSVRELALQTLVSVHNDLMKDPRKQRSKRVELDITNLE